MDSTASRAAYEAALDDLRRSAAAQRALVAQAMGGAPPQRLSPPRT